jgi:hypothetical protein
VPLRSAGAGATGAASGLSQTTYRRVRAPAGERMLFSRPRARGARAASLRPAAPPPEWGERRAGQHGA